MFKNIKTGNYLDLADAFAQSGQQIQLYKKNGTYAQKWIVRKYGERYRIASACNPDFMIDLSGADLKDDGYGHLNLWYDNGTLAQRGMIMEHWLNDGTLNKFMTLVQF